MSSDMLSSQVVKYLKLKHSFLVQVRYSIYKILHLTSFTVLHSTRYTDLNEVIIIALNTVTFTGITRWVSKKAKTCTVYFYQVAPSCGFSLQGTSTQNS